MPKIVQKWQTADGKEFDDPRTATLHELELADAELIAIYLKEQNLPPNKNSEYQSRMVDLQKWLRAREGAVVPQTKRAMPEPDTSEANLDELVAQHEAEQERAAARPIPQHLLEEDDQGSFDDAFARAPKLS